MVLLKKCYRYADCVDAKKSDTMLEILKFHSAAVSKQPFWLVLRAIIINLLIMKGCFKRYLYLIFNGVENTLDNKTQQLLNEFNQSSHKISWHIFGVVK